MSETNDPDQLPSQRLGAPSPHVSPTLSRLAPSLRPDPYPACADCPASDWYATLSALRCFCSAYRKISWQKDDAPVMACDARETAIAVYRAEHRQG